jgi:hypothetical protein
MQPIKTTNAMNPAPAKGIQSLPTPVIDDVIITEMVNAWKGDYQKLEYGTMWDSVPHGSQQGSFPEHKLVFQQTSSEDGQWVKRIWVNDRVNQDSYNYAIKYSAGSLAHPIYTRTYIVPRDTYAPLPDGTPDTLFPTAVLVDEMSERTGNELDSRYITVTRVYETLPGPEVPTRRYNQRGDLETVIVQTVGPNVQPDPDGLLVTGSQVEQVEVGKGVKTTSTVTDHSVLQIKEKKEGLLGETVTTDDIVVPSTEPDALSESVVASVVEQFSATKARKRTTTTSGPTSLSKKSKDGKFLGDVISTQSIVAPNTDPDSPSSTIISSEINQIDSGKAIKTNIVLNSTPTFSGNQNEQGLFGIKSTSERIVDAGTPADELSLSVLSSQVEPIDSVRSRKVTVRSTGPTFLNGAQKKDGLLGEFNVVESIVVAGSQPDALTQTIISSQVEPIDSAKSKKTTTTSIGPASLTATSLVDTAVGQVPANIEKSIVTPSQVPSGGKFVLQDQISAIDSAKSQRERVTVSSYPELTTYDLDEQLGVVVITERNVVDHNEPYAAPPLVLTLTDRPLDQWKTLRITSRLSQLPPDRTEYKTQQFSFPALLVKATTTDLNLGFGRVPINEEETEWKAGINKFISITPDIRAALSLPARIRIVTTFYNSPPVPDLPYQITTQNVSYNGSLFGFNFGDVLYDGGILVGPITANNYDQRFSGLTESISFAPSVPTRSQYNSLIGTEVVIFSDVEYYKSNIWFKRTGYVTLV